MRARSISLAPNPRGFVADTDSLRLGIAARRLLEALSFGVIPIASIPVLSALMIRAHTFASDFSGWYWPAGARLLHGLSPYTAPYPHALYYPAPGLLVFAPFSLVPRPVGAALFTAIVIAAVLAALHIAGVRDRRLYGLVMLFEPVVLGWKTGNITLLLCLGLAVGWRVRNRPALAGLTIAVLIAVKLLFWPLGIWLLATRRYVAAAWCGLFTFTITAIAWMVTGFGELRQYISALRSFTAHAEHVHYGVVSLALHAGSGRVLAYAVAGAAGAVALGGCVINSRRGQDRDAFTWCVSAVLLLSPVVETHYLVLLLVPMALAHPSLRVVWLVPLGLWVLPAQFPNVWQCAIALVLGAAMVAGALSRSSDRQAFPQKSFMVTAA